MHMLIRAHEEPHTHSVPPSRWPSRVVVRWRLAGVGPKYLGGLPPSSAGSMLCSVPLGISHQQVGLSPLGFLAPHCCLPYSIGVALGLGLLATNLSPRQPLQALVVGRHHYQTARDKAHSTRGLTMLSRMQPTLTKGRRTQKQLFWNVHWLPGHN